MSKFQFLQRFALLLFFSFSLFVTQAQKTVGLLSFDHQQAQPGYNLIYPHFQSNVYLLDNCGEVVNTWEDSIYRPGNSVYLMEDGRLYKTISQEQNSPSPIFAGGAGEGFQIRDWDNNLLWEWSYIDSTHRLHHDMAIMPNGNILAIAWERMTGAEAIQAGRDPNFLDDGELWPEHIIEIEPVGTSGANIVWEWHAKDHLIQNYDSNQQNYGDPAAHPELIDINFGSGIADWLHANAIDYNPGLDQIILSIPKFHEVWIIDHSTTTAEAAGHTGGNSGRGGDLLFRWGNPEAYMAGDSTDQKLFYQHDIHWIDDGASTNDPDYGKLMVFNNRVGEDYSTVNIFEPVFDLVSNSYQMTGGTFDPPAFDWSYQRPDSNNLYSKWVSSVQRLMNGNTLILDGVHGYGFEITPNEDIVWEYKNPMLNGQFVTQGTVLASVNNMVFRMTRYADNYPAFNGVDLSPKSFLELNPDTAFCDLPTSVSEVTVDESEMFSIFPNPASSSVTIRNNTGEGIESLKVFDSVGRQVFSHVGTNSSLTIPINEWERGIYLIMINNRQVQRLVVNN